MVTQSSKIILLATECASFNIFKISDTQFSIGIVKQAKHISSMVMMPFNKLQCLQLTSKGGTNFTVAVL